MNTFDIALRTGQLPQKIEELVPLSFIGQAAVDFYRNKLKAQNNLDVAQEQRQSTLKDGQDAGRMLLAIEGRIGELLPEPEEALKTTLYGAIKAKRPEGINSQQAFNARSIARHPAEVAEVIKEAEENEDIPTKTAVLNKVKYKKVQARLERAETRAAEKTEKDDIREVKEHPKCVKEYLDVSKQYNSALRLAIKCARGKMFSPESIQFIKNRHSQTRKLMEELEVI